MTWNEAIKNLHHRGQGDVFRAVTRLEFVKSKQTLAWMVERAAPSISPPTNREACGELLDGKPV